MSPHAPPVPLAVVSPTAAVAWSALPTQPAARDCVSVPFTAPALLAARARPAADGGVKMLLGNPAGGRNIHVARGPVLRACVSPSLHDILLADRIETLGGPDAPLSPASIRAAAIDIAAAGHAGRRLARAAESGRAAEQLAHRRLRAHLLLRACAQRCACRAARLRAQRSVGDRSRRSTAGWLAGAAEAAGRPSRPVRAPVRSMAFLRAVRRDRRRSPRLACASRDRSRHRTGRVLPRVLRLMEEAARTARDGANLSGGEALLIALDRGARRRGGLHSSAARAGAWLDDPLALLAAMARGSWRSLARVLQRGDWLLDGWDRLCLLSRQGMDIAAPMRRPWSMTAKSARHHGPGRAGLQPA